METAARRAPLIVELCTPCSTSNRSPRQGLPVGVAPIFTERPWPARLERTLGVLAGPIVALAVVQAEHLRALIGARTKHKTVAAWLEELLTADRDALAPWRPEAELACSMAMSAYECVRGGGPSVVLEHAVMVEGKEG